MNCKIPLWLPIVVLLLVVAVGSAVGGCGKPATATTTTETTATNTTATTATPGSEEIEATEFQGVALTPISRQGNAALSDIPAIDRDSYVLTIDGLVEEPLSLSYADLQAYEQESWLMDLNCVEGWSFTAKWTGPSLSAILDDAGVEPEALIAIFYTADIATGYTSLDLSYIRDNGILLALKLNDVTLPPDRGFPLQVVAKSKLGYKWAKWVTRIELSSDTSFRGYWESRGYSNDADVSGPASE